MSYKCYKCKIIFHWLEDHDDHQKDCQGIEPPNPYEVVKEPVSELIRYAAIDILGYRRGTSCYGTRGITAPDGVFFPDDPGEDDNHLWFSSDDLDLIEAELVKLGFVITEFKKKEYKILIVKDGLACTSVTCEYDIKQIRLTRLTAMVEAHKKLTTPAIKPNNEMDG